MLIFPTPEADHLQGEVLTLCTCWEIHRVDEMVLRVTDHDQPVAFSEKTFSPVGGFSASASQKQGGLKSRNRDLLGTLTADAITDADLRAGRYRDAAVTEFLVNWVTSTPLVFNTYWINAVKFDGESWQATVTGLTDWLDVDVGQIVTRSCRHKFGDARCTVNLGGYTTTGTITSFVDPRVEFSTSVTGAVNDYANGKIQFLTGLNHGLTYEIKSNDAAGSLVLWIRLPFNVAPGDSVKVTRGCDKSKGACQGYSNFINFGGFLFVPGTDRSLQTPKTKE